MGGAVALNQHRDLLKKLDLPDYFEVEVIVAVGKAAAEPEHEGHAHRYQLVRK